MGISVGVVVAVLVISATQVPVWLLPVWLLPMTMAGLAVWALPTWWYRVRRWEITDTAVYIRTGYFWQEWRVAPMSRIQTVDTLRGPMQRRFGLSTVTVTTASAKSALKIEGLDAQVASDLADQLTETTQATPGDAT
ncbi:hypothetical protein GCM10027563_07140 [Parasphingorhabdus pacifica]